MSGRANLLANLMPGPDEVEGADGIQSPDATAGGIAMPIIQQDEPIDVDEDEALIREEEEALANLRRARERRQAGTRSRQAQGTAAANNNGDGAATAGVSTPAASNRQLIPPTTAGPPIVTGATPRHQVHSPMASQTGGNQQPARYVTSGFRRAVGALELVINNPMLIRGELSWQRSATDPEARKQFRAQLLAQMGFRCMGFMRPNSAHIHVVHSMANCFMPNGGAAEYQNKGFGFLA